MTVMLDNRNEGLWTARQTSGQGNIVASVAERQLRKVGGDVSVNRTDGSSVYSEGSRFGDRFDFIETIVGEGSPVAQAQPATLGHWATLMLGTDTVGTVSSSASIYEHVITPGTSGFWFTLWKKVGSQVGPLRQKFGDCRPVSYRLDGSSANKVLTQTLELLSLRPGIVYATDPVQALGTEDPFVYTEATSRWVIDGTTIPGIGSFGLLLGDGFTPWYGDDVVPATGGFGIAQVALDNMTLAVDANGLARYNQVVYGSTAPAAGVEPLKTVPPRGSFVTEFRKGHVQTIAVTGAPTGGSLTITVPAIAGITGGGTTASIAYNATASAVQAALDAVLGGSGRVTVTGGPWPGTLMTIRFRDYLGASGGALTTTNSFTGGTSPNTTVIDIGHNRGLKIDVPSVHWNPDVAISGNPEGGNTELAIGAQAGVPATGQIVTLTVRNGDSTSYSA